MSDREDQYDESAVFDRRNDAIVANPIAPQTFEIASERLAEPARVFSSGNALAQIAENRLLCDRSELAQIARRVAIEFDTPNRILNHNVSAR